MPDMRTSSTLFSQRRTIYFLCFLFCAALIGFALYLQHRLGEDPCPLCIFQRVAVMVLGIFFLLASLHHPRGFGVKIYALLQFATAAIGAGIAARHVWLQHLPKDQVPECGPGLSYMMDAFPILQTLKMVLQGSGECAAVGWTFLHLSIPEWTLLCFIGLGAIALWQSRNRRA
jgi:protein dithiol:quinone oxidoreductase